MPTVALGQFQIHYTLTGQSKDTLLIFPDNLHAAQAYEQEIVQFSARYQVLAFDYPGFGQSSHEWLYSDELEVDYFGFRADLACHLLAELNLTACHVLGVGGGALAALHFAGRQAALHQLRPLSLMADSFLADFNSRALHRWLDVREHFYVRNARRLESWHGADWRALADADTRFLRGLADRGGYAIPEKFINAIPCRTLLTGHLQDPALPDIAREYARLCSLIPNCSIYLAGTAGHPTIERPFLWSNPVAFYRTAELFWEQL
ncbi:MAG: alpha/beta fold hydrolase [Chloroflexota bacterium]